METRARQSTVCSGKRGGGGRKKKPQPQTLCFVPQPSATTKREVLPLERHAAGAAGCRHPRPAGSRLYKTECFSTGTVSSLAADSSRNQSSCPERGRTRAAGRGSSSSPSKMRCWERGNGASAERSAKGNRKPHLKRFGGWLKPLERSFPPNRLGFSFRRRTVWVQTFKTAALPSPVATNTTIRAAFSTGRVNVIRSAGGFGESVIAATIFSFSCQREKITIKKKKNNVKRAGGKAPTRKQGSSPGPDGC